jgi:hypothetical protein
MANREREKPDQDVRVQATSRIWGITVGILAVCIPLSSVTRSGVVLPLAAITGASVGTVAVWRSNEKKSITNSMQTQQLQQIEKRIANLETIVISDELGLQRKFQQIESRKSAGFLGENHPGEN